VDISSWKSLAHSGLAASGASRRTWAAPTGASIFHIHIFIIQYG
jgi:hypothetical protein